MPIILDADALFMLNYDFSLVDGYKKCILTPNVMEFKRLHEHIVRFKRHLELILMNFDTSLILNTKKHQKLVLKHNVQLFQI